MKLCNFGNFFSLPYLNRIVLQLLYLLCDVCHKFYNILLSGPIYETLETYPLNQSNQNFRYYLKVCTGDFDDFKQHRAHDFSYRERILKFLINDIHFSLAQIDQGIEKPQVAMERLAYD